MASGTGVKDSVRTMQTFLQFLMGLSLAAAIVFAFVEDLTVDLVLAAAAAGLGLWFVQTSRGVLDSPSTAGNTRLQNLLYAFVGAMVLSWLASLIDKEFLDAIELLSVAWTVLAVYLMLSVIAEARRLSRS